MKILHAIPGLTLYDCGCRAVADGRMTCCPLHEQASALREGLALACAALAVISTGVDEAAPLKLFARLEFDKARAILRAAEEPPRRRRGDRTLRAVKG